MVTLLLVLIRNASVTRLFKPYILFFSILLTQNLMWQTHVHSSSLNIVFLVTVFLLLQKNYMKEPHSYQFSGSFFLIHPLKRENPHHPTGHTGNLYDDLVCLEDDKKNLCFLSPNKHEIKKKPSSKPLSSFVHGQGNGYHFYTLWYDPVRDCTHNIPISGQTLYH